MSLGLSLSTHDAQVSIAAGCVIKTCTHSFISPSHIGRAEIRLKLKMDDSLSLLELLMCFALSPRLWAVQCIQKCERDRHCHQNLTIERCDAIRDWGRSWGASQTPLRVDFPPHPPSQTQLLLLEEAKRCDFKCQYIGCDSMFVCHTFFCF